MSRFVARLRWVRTQNAALLLGGALFAVTVSIGGAAADPRPAAPDSPPPPLQLVQTIPLPGVEGRIDHMALDAERQRLFLAALGNHSAEVVDLAAGKWLQSLRGVREPQGVAFVPKRGATTGAESTPIPEAARGHLPDSARVLVTSGHDGACDFFDAETLQHALRIKLSDDADNVCLDAAAGHVYVGFGAGGIAILDARDGAILGSIPLGGHPEGLALESHGARLFVNLPASGDVAVVDRVARSVRARWRVTKAADNFPLALDESGHRLFVGCRPPANLQVLNTDTGKVVAKLDLDDSSDDISYDAARHRIYVSCGGGFVDVFQQNGPDRYIKLAKVATAKGARTSLFVPETSRLYVAIPKRFEQRAELRVYSAQP